MNWGDERARERERERESKRERQRKREREQKTERKQTDTARGRKPVKCEAKCSLVSAFCSH